MSNQQEGGAAGGAPSAVRRARQIRRGPRKNHPAATRILGFICLVIASAVLWPASWGGFTGLTLVDGHSMEPTYVTGDLVVTFPRATYDPGDIVSYVIPDGQAGAGNRVIHRIVSVDDSTSTRILTTQGDNNPNPDIWKISDRDVVGKAIARLPGAGRIVTRAHSPLVLGATAGLVTMMLLWPDRKRSTHKTM